MLEPERRADLPPLRCSEGGLFVALARALAGQVYCARHDWFDCPWCEQAVGGVPARATPGSWEPPVTEARVMRERQDARPQLASRPVARDGARQRYATGLAGAAEGEL